MRTREFLGIDLQVMAVELRDFLVGLAEDQLLLVADADMGGAALAVLLDLGRRIEDLAVEARDAVRGPFRYGELDIAHAEIDRAEPLFIRLVEAEPIAPRAGRLDIGVVLLAVELGVGELFLGFAETLAELFERRNNETDMAAQHVRVAGRQMKLALADIDPHVVGAREHVGVAGQAERRQIKLLRQPLIVDSEIDVFETDEVAEILGCAIVELLRHRALQICRSANAERPCCCSAGMRRYQNSFSKLSSTGTR